MIKVIASHALSPAEASGSRRLSDPDLLLDIAGRFDGAAPPEGSLSDEFSLILHDLRMGGTWKRTSRGRLPCAERMICAHLVPPAAGEIAVLDLGASDGITTLDLAAALRTAFGDRVRVFLTDLNLWLLRYRKGPVVEYRAANGEPIMARIGRVGLRLARERHDQERGADPIAAAYLMCRGLRQSMRLDARISLIHPLVARDPAITAMELDCVARVPELAGRFAAIRASNVLNPGYFSPAQMQAAIGNMHAYLRERGCIVISRNQDGPTGEVENGSVWRKTGERFAHVADFGAGSEIKSLLDGWLRS